MAKGASRYVVGIDLGTTYTAAAVHTVDHDGDDDPTRRGRRLRHPPQGRWHMAELGTRSTTIPSLVLLRTDGTFLAGEAAERRAAIEPGRAAREFKRRLGDSVPILLGGSPFSAEQLTARLLRHTLERIREVEGGAPAAIALTHPANWGTFKVDVLRAAVRIAGEDPARVTFLAEPEAAALAYAAHDRPPEGARVAVYDLGGGTFDVAILEDRGDRYALVGVPGGIERLGGIDFDEALFRHVLRLVDGADALDADDPSITADLIDLRRACIAAKEALSAETDTAVTVRIGPIRQEIRIVRAEFEALIRPTLEYTTDALAHTLEAAGLVPEDLHAVLLVGGSSRIPLVGQLVAAALRRPIALDIHPKHAVALGAALVAAGTSPSEVADGQALPLVIISRAGEDQTDPYGPPPAGAAVAAPATAPRDRADVEPTPRPAAPAGKPPEAASPAPNRTAPAAAGPGPPRPPESTPPDPPARPAAPATAPPTRTPPAPAATPAAPATPAPPTRSPPAPAAAPDAVPTPPPPTTPVPRRNGAAASGATGRSGTSARAPLRAASTGAVVGLVVLAALLLLRRDTDDDGGERTTTTFTEEAVVPTRPPSTTSTLAPLDPTIRTFLTRVVEFDDDVELIANAGTPVLDACTAFLAELEADYGAAPLDAPAVPPALAERVAAADPAYRELLASIIDVITRRLRACTAGDGATYQQLRADESALRQQLVDL